MTEHEQQEEERRKKRQREEEEERALKISTDGGVAIGIGGGLTIDSHGHLGVSIGGMSIPFGGGD